MAIEEQDARDYVNALILWCRENADYAKYEAKLLEMEEQFKGDNEEQKFLDRCFYGRD